MFACLYLPPRANSLHPLRGQRARGERRTSATTIAHAALRADRARFFAARRDAWGPHGHARHQRARQPHWRAAIDWRRAAPHGGRCRIARAHRCGIHVDRCHPARARARRTDRGAGRRRSDGGRTVTARSTRSAVRSRLPPPRFTLRTVAATARQAQRTYRTPRTYRTGAPRRT